MRRNNPKIMNTSQVTRVELIDSTISVEAGGGRCFVKRDCSVELQIQDDNRTLKVFLTPKK